MDSIPSLKDQWYEHQIGLLSDTLAELVSDDDPHIARKAIYETIESWTSYHKKEVEKWNTLRNLLSL